MLLGEVGSGTVLAMSAGRYNLFIEQGSTFKLAVTVTIGDPPTPVDLTGFVARLGVKHSFADPDLVLLLREDTPTANGSQLTLGGVAGTVDILITDEDTEAMTTQPGVYDLLIEDAAGTATRLLKGTVTVDPGVTPVL